MLPFLLAPVCHVALRISLDDSATASDALGNNGHTCSGSKENVYLKIRTITRDTFKY